MGNTVTAAAAFKTINYTLDKLHSYFGQIRGSAALTPPNGGHTGQAGDLAMDFGGAGSTKPISADPRRHLHESDREQRRHDILPLD